MGNFALAQCSTLWTFYVLFRERSSCSSESFLIQTSFLAISNWTQISIAACFLLAASAGLTLVMITGCIDVSIGSIAYLAAASVYLTSGYLCVLCLDLVVAISVGVGAGLLSWVSGFHYLGNEFVADDTGTR